MKKKHSFRHTEKIVKTIFILMVLTTSSGCAKFLINMSLAPTLTEVIDEARDLDSMRLVMEGLPANIVTVSALAEIAEDNISLLSSCAYMHLAYGLFMDDTDPEYALELFEIGRSFGMRALMTNNAFKKGIEAGRPVSELTGLLRKKHAAALYWTAFNAGSSVVKQLDDPMALMDMADITEMVKRAMVLEPDFFFGSGDVFMGTLYAMVPKAVNPDAGIENARKAFDRASEVTDGKFLLADLYRARFLAASIGDEEMFESLLVKILSADSSALKGGKTINELAKAKAGFYLEHKEEIMEE